MDKITMCEEIESVDRISQLPNCILHHILFYLPPKDEVRTCLVSKSWNADLWSRGSFYFNQIASIGNDLALYTHERQQEFIHHVEGSLQRLKTERFIIPMFSVRIHLFNPEISFFIDRWMQLAARHHLRLLCLLITVEHRQTDLYKFPMPLASVGHLKKILVLQGCKLDRTSLCAHDDHSNAEPLALEELVLFKVEINTQDENFQNFISRCSSLNKLTIKHCYGLKTLRLCNHPKLKELHINVHLEQRPDAIRLERVDVDSLDLQTITLTGMPHPRRPLIVRATRCSNLLHLDITSTKLKVSFLRKISTYFPLLQSLSLHYCYCPGLEDLFNLRHPLLKTLNINDFNELGEIDTPNLRLFKFRGAKIPTNLVLSSASSCSTLVKESYLSLSPSNQLNAMWFLLLRDCLRKFNEYKLTLSLVVHSPTEFIMNEVTTFDLPCHVKLLKLRLCNTMNTSSSLLDGLFWTCHPKHLCVRRTNLRFNNDSLKFMCEILITARKEDPVCCDSSQIKCWRHFLKNVTIKGIDTTSIAFSEEESMMQHLSTYKKVLFTLEWL